MNYTLKNIAEITGGKLVGVDSQVYKISTDSRTQSDSQNLLFVAISGANHDAHCFIAQLYGQGVRAFIVERAVDYSQFPQAGFVSCKNSVEALQRLAANHRSDYKGRVVAITGSNGKTVVKEWVAQLAPRSMRLFRSPKSYNSQIGVALSLLMLDENSDVAIIEAGISKPDEMARLEAMIRPETVLFTNIGDAHQENFTSTEQKLEQKLQLARRANTIIYNPTQELVSESIERGFGDRNLIKSDVSKYDLSALRWYDQASVENLSQALSLLELLGADMREVNARISTLQNIAMRLELKEGVGASLIINDSYNSDINSLSIALDYMASVGGGRSRVLILSDILQSGFSSAELYARVSALIKEKGVDRLIGIGTEIFKHAALFDCEKEFFLRTDTFISSCKKEDYSNAVILVKGSRAFQFEKISRMLERKVHTTILEVNLDNMIHNLNFYRSKLDKHTKVFAMVKALSYGSGSYEVANMLQTQGVDYLAVAFADEGIALREAGIKMPIVVLNADSDSFDSMIDYRLDPEIYSFNSLGAFKTALRRAGENGYPIHVKFDTGMHRLGFEAGDLHELISALKGDDLVSVCSLFSHLAASENPDEDVFTRSQIELFRSMSDLLCGEFPQKKIIRHICNSAAIERFPEAQFDAVRLGIGLYGVSSACGQSLLHVSSLKSRIVQIKELHAGQTVGYGRRGVIDRDVRIATVPIGYADGLDRRLGCGNWAFMVCGRQAPIVGNICMDTCMIDVTGIEVSEGDQVTVFGQDPTVSQMAQKLDTIAYEVLTNISNRVKRIYIKE